MSKKRDKLSKYCTSNPTNKNKEEEGIISIITNNIDLPTVAITGKIQNGETTPQ